MTAEAWGGHLALDLLADCSASPREARLGGDNLAIVRFIASNGKLKEPRLRLILDHSLDRAQAIGWRLECVAIRRRFNKGADRAATTALEHARVLHDQGVSQACIWTVQHNP